MKLRFIIKLLILSLFVVSCQKETIQPPKPLETELFLGKGKPKQEVIKPKKKRKRKLFKKIFAR